jgi:hypothetical protein
VQSIISQVMHEGRGHCHLLVHYMAVIYSLTQERSRSVV